MIDENSLSIVAAVAAEEAPNPAVEPEPPAAPRAAARMEDEIEPSIKESAIVAPSAVYSEGIMPGDGEGRGGVGGRHVSEEGGRLLLL